MDGMDDLIQLRVLPTALSLWQRLASCPPNSFPFPFWCALDNTGQLLMQSAKIMVELMSVNSVLGPFRNRLKSKPSHAVTHTLIPLVFSGVELTQCKSPEVLGTLEPRYIEEGSAVGWIPHGVLHNQEMNISWIKLLIFGDLIMKIASVICPK